MPPLRVAHTHRRVAAGVSLVELLIASVILALGASLLSGVLLAANRSGDLRRQHLVAAQLSASALAQLEARPVPDEAQQTLAHGTDTYTAAVQTTARTTPAGELMQARVTVVGPTATSTLTTLRLPPPPQEQE